MNNSGRVQRIHIAGEPGVSVEPVESVEAVKKRGLRGDRYFINEGTFSDRKGSDITFIEAESLAAVERDYGITLERGVHRRNITTTGIALNHLIERDFEVGGAICRGENLCEPCAYLENHLEKKGIRKALVHRGGLRATVLDGGKISIGDSISPL